MGDLYAAQIVGVGFHSSPGEDAASGGIAIKIKPRRHAKERQEKTKKSV
jgi:hypothetical protein